MNEAKVLAYEDNERCIWSAGPDYGIGTGLYVAGYMAPRYPVPAIPSKVDWHNVFCLGHAYKEVRISTNNGWDTLKSWKF